MKDIKGRAEAGDADAQYALAAMFAGRRLLGQSRQWLERAAENGHADALFTLSAARLSGVAGVSADLAAAIDGLTQAAAKGSASARRMLAALKAAGFADGGWPEALSLMRDACEAGDGVALREIAVIAFDAGCDDEGEAMLAEAAKHDAVAAALIERRRRRGAFKGAATYDLDRVIAALQTEAKAPPAVDVSQKPRAKRFPNAAAIELCDHLIATALPRQERQEIVDKAGVAHAHPHRTSTGAVVGFGHLDLPAVRAGRKMARLADAPYQNGESVLVLRYRPGEEYRPHHDFLGADEPDLKMRGQRVKTALLYLNDGYEGGETHFLSPDIRIAGAAGEILVFENVDETGAPDVSARHSGRPIIRGEKWLATLWLRDRPFMR